MPRKGLRPIGILMRYVLHIGTNKTGTSTLQAYLGTLREELLQRGIWYPRIGNFEYAHHDLAEAIKLGGEFARFNIDPKSIAGEAVPSGVHTVIISSENFHTVRDISAVAALFPPDRTQVVLYLREHISYLSSWYQQDVQAARALITCSFFEYAQLRGYPFMDLVERWQAVYGENLHVGAYDRNKLSGGDIVEDFFSVAFKSGPPIARRFEDKNPSISGNLLFTKLVLNHLLTVEESLRIVEELSALATLDKRFTGKISITERDAKRLAHRFGDDRKQLREKFGIGFKPPREGVQANPVPDFDTLHHDIGLLLQTAKDRSFAFHDIFMKKRDLMFSGL
jgi:hypothetical protein